MTNEPLSVNQLKSPKKSKIWQILGLVGIIVALLFAGSVIYWRYFKKEGIFANFPGLKTPEATSALDGTRAEASLANRHPLAVMVENHPDARPQAGLDKASIVYEAITEGGITRFMAIFGPRDANKIGPVRSARTYFIDWTAEFNAFYAHCGGNLDALDKIKSDRILDLDQFALGETAYWREPEAGKAIEHTMFTATDRLYTAAKKKGWTETANFTKFKFRDQNAAAYDTNPIQRVEIDFSEPQYRVVWNYDRTSNTYLRNMAGAPHRDKITGNQLSPSNIVIQEIERWEAPTTINEQGWAMKTIGSGQAKILAEGQLIKGTWRKTSQTDRTLFYDENGTEIKFIPGQLWVEIVPPEVFGKIIIES